MVKTFLIFFLYFNKFLKNSNKLTLHSSMRSKYSGVHGIKIIELIKTVGHNRITNGATWYSRIDPNKYPSITPV